MAHRDRNTNGQTSPLRIGLIYPGHQFSTLWVAEGIHAALNIRGTGVDDIRFERLIAASGNYVSANAESFKAAKDGVTLTEWGVHIAIQFMLARMLEIANRVDLFLVVCGNLITPQTYRALNNLPTPRVILLTESPYEDEAQKMMTSQYDFAFTNDKFSVDTLSEAAPTVYLRHAFDPQVYHPLPNRDEKKWDVCFVGTPFKNRDIAVESINKRDDISAYIFKDVIERVDGELKTMTICPPSSTMKLYNESKVCLNVHRTEKYYGTDQHIEVPAYSIGPRAFAIAGSAGFQLCDNSRPELKDIFGDTVATFDNPEDVGELVRYWCDPARDDQREEMARASYYIAMEHHTYEDRVEELIAQLADWYGRPDWKEIPEDPNVLRMKQAIEKVS